MDRVNIENREKAFRQLTGEFLQVVGAFCAEPSTRNELQCALQQLEEYDSIIQNKFVEASSDAAAALFYRHMEHDFTYVWVGLRQFKHPQLRSSSIQTLEETFSSLQNYQQNFDEQFNPLVPLNQVIRLMKGLDYSQTALHPSPT